MRTIRSYLPNPDHQEKSVIMQARVPINLRDKIRQIAKKNKWNSSQVIRAGLEMFLDDEKKVHEEVFTRTG